MSTKAIQSLERSIDALLARAGTPQERTQDVSMVEYLRGRIREIQDANKKRLESVKTSNQAKEPDPLILDTPDESVPDWKNNGNHRSRKAGEA